MTEAAEIPMEEFRIIVKRAGLDLSDEILERVKSLYDEWAGNTATLHELDLGDEDVAVSFSPAWPKFE